MGWVCLRDPRCVPHLYTARGCPPCTIPPLCWGVHILNFQPSQHDVAFVDDPGAGAESTIQPPISVDIRHAEAITLVSHQPAQPEGEWILGPRAQLLEPHTGAGYPMPLLRPGPVLLMAHLTAHQGAGVADTWAAAGVRLLSWPPYAPDVSPIEAWWSKVKALVQAQAAWTLEALEQAIAEGPRLSQARMRMGGLPMPGTGLSPTEKRCHVPCQPGESVSMPWIVLPHHATLPPP